MYDENISNAACINTTRSPLVYFVLTTALALLVFQTTASAQTTVSLKSTITLPNSKKLTGFDISWVDPESRVYLLADSGNNEIYNGDPKNPSNVYSNSGFNPYPDPNVPFGGPSGPNGVA